MKVSRPRRRGIGGKQIILHVPADKFDALLLAGAKLSNICFNLSQRDNLPQDIRQSMKESQIEWDIAKSNCRIGDLQAAIKETN